MSNLNFRNLNTKYINYNSFFYQKFNFVLSFTRKLYYMNIDLFKDNSFRLTVFNINYESFNQQDKQ